MTQQPLPFFRAKLPPPKAPPPPDERLVEAISHATRIPSERVRAYLAGAHAAGPLAEVLRCELWRPIEQTRVHGERSGGKGQL